MDASENALHGGPSASKQIDAIIGMHADWRGETLARLRALIMGADPAIVEEVKWKKPSRPEGVPVWSCGGNLCIADILKSAVRLTFPKGARMEDPTQLFNARLDSTGVRAIDLHQWETLDEAALTALIRDALRLNSTKYVGNVDNRYGDARDEENAICIDTMPDNRCGH
jgi:hypothetical protein